MSFDDDLSAAADAIRDWTACRKDMSRLEGLVTFEHAQQSSDLYTRARLASESKNVDLERAAYEAAWRCERNNEVYSAVHWYRIAAEEDYADSAYRLANLLTTLLVRLIQEGELDPHDDPLEQYMDLLLEITKWYTQAYRAGHDNSLALLADILDQWGPSFDRLARRVKSKKVLRSTQEWVCVEYAAQASDFFVGSLSEHRGYEIRKHLDTCSTCVGDFYRILETQPAPIRNEAASSNRTFVCTLYVRVFGGMTLPS